MKIFKLCFLITLLFPLFSKAMDELTFFEAQINNDSFFYGQEEAIKANIKRIRQTFKELEEQEINIIDEKWKVIFRDASYYSECSDLIKLMLEKGIDPNSDTCLAIAAKRHNIEIVELLLDHKDIQVDIQDDLFNDTALTAIFYHKILNLKVKNICKELILVLLRSGANPYLKNKQKKNAVMLARENGFDDLAKLMEDFWNESMPESD